MEEKEEKREIHEMTAVILVLAYDTEDAAEQAGKQVVIDDLLEGPVKSDWSHLDDPQPTIDRITREIKRRERYH